MRVTSRVSAAGIFLIATGLGVSPSDAGRGNPEKYHTPEQLTKNIQKHDQTAFVAQQQFEHTYKTAASTGNAQIMHEAFRLRATALRAQVDSLRSKAFLAGIQGRTEEAAALKGEIPQFRSELIQLRELQAKGGLSGLAQQEAARQKSKIDAALPSERALTWKEARTAFQQQMKLKEFTKASQALQQMEAAVGGGLFGRLRRFQLGRDKKALTKAKDRLDKTLLRDAINGRLDFATVNKGLTRMERDAQKGNPLSRFVKRAKLAWKARSIRRAVERKIKQAIRGGGVGKIDADLLKWRKENKLVAEIREAWKKREQQWIQEEYFPSMVKVALQGGNPEADEVQKILKQRKREVRREFFDGLRIEIKQATLIQGLAILDRLDQRTKRTYSENKSVRSFLNEQVRRFSSWVLGSPQRSREKAERELVKHADYLSKKRKDVNSHLQAHLLLLTAKQLKVGDTKEFEKVRAKAIERVQKSIKDAVARRDPGAVKAAYGLYAAYGMDHKGREWDGPETTINFHRDLTKAQRRLVDKLSKLARHFMFHPKDAAMGGFNPSVALFLNGAAATLAEQFASETPGAIPQGIWDRIDFNKELIDGRGKKAKLVKLWHHPLNVVAWPWRIFKGILAQPAALFKPHRMPKQTRELQELVPLLEKYVQHPELAMTNRRVEEPKPLMPPPGTVLGGNAAPPPGGGDGPPQMVTE